MRPSLCWLLLTAACACAFSDSLAGAEYMDEDFPPWTCDTEGTTGECATTGNEPAASCQGTEDCAGQVCAASFNGEIGEFECQSTCIDAFDDDRWCVDAGACCDLDATCERGYCVPPEVEPSSTSEDTGTGTESSSGDTDAGSSGTDAGSSGTDDGTGTSSATGTDGGTTETGGAS